MRKCDNRLRRERRTWRRMCRSGAGIAALTLVLAGAAGCERATTDLAKEFRAAAAPSLQAGIQSIASGIIDGVFALVEPANPPS